MKQAIYFGCSGENKAGHYPHMANGMSPPYNERWMEYFDGKLAPHGTEQQGLAMMHRIHGYTVISFWDRTGDKRPNSNSAFWLPDGALSFAQALDESKRLFPWVFARFKTFEVTLHPSLVEV